MLRSRGPLNRFFSSFQTPRDPRGDFQACAASTSACRGRVSDLQALERSTTSRNDLQGLKLSFFDPQASVTYFEGLSRLPKTSIRHIDQFFEGDPFLRSNSRFSQFLTSIKAPNSHSFIIQITDLYRNRTSGIFRGHSLKLFIVPIW